MTHAQSFFSSVSRRHFECYFFKSPHYVPPGIRWEDLNGVGMDSRDGKHLYSLPGFTHFVSRKSIDLLLNQLKFEKTDNVYIKGIHSGFWQNFLSLLAQMVVEQEAEKLFCLHSTTNNNTASLNQISLFWDGLARTNPNIV